MKYSIIILLLLPLFAHTQIEPAILEAMKSSDTVEMNRLFSRGIDINSVDENGANILMHSLLYHTVKPFDMASFLVRKGAREPEKGFITNGYAYTGSLLAAVSSYDWKLETLKLLVEKLNCDPNKREFNPKTGKFSGWTPIEYACDKGAKKTFNYLISKGADPDSRSSIALCRTIEKNHWDLFEKLMSMDVYTNGIDRETGRNNGPIHFAIRKDIRYLKALMEKGADSEIRNGRGKTALELALNNKHWIKVFYLLQFDAYTGQLDHENLSDEQSAIIGENRLEFLESEILSTPKTASKRDWLHAYRKSDDLGTIGLDELMIKVKKHLDEFALKNIEEEIPEFHQNRFEIGKYYFESRDYDQASIALDKYQKLESQILENENFANALKWLAITDSENQEKRRKELEEYEIMLSNSRHLFSDEFSSVSYEVDVMSKKLEIILKILGKLDEKSTIVYNQSVGKGDEAFVQITYEDGDFWMTKFGRNAWEMPLTITGIDKIATEISENLIYNEGKVVLSSRSKQINGKKQFYILDKKQYQIEDE